MPSASVVKELNCTNCEKPLVINGRVKCPRCKQQIELPASLPEGKWFCPECPAHGEKPHVLAVSGQIKCRWCGGDKNSLIQKEEKMTTDKVAEVLEMVKNFSPEERKQLVEGINSLFFAGKETKEETIERLLKKALSLTKEGETKWSVVDKSMGYPCPWMVDHEASVGGAEITITESAGIPIGYDLRIKIDGGLMEWSAGFCLRRVFDRRRARMFGLIRKILKADQRNYKTWENLEKKSQEATALSKLARS